MLLVFGRQYDVELSYWLCDQRLLGLGPIVRSPVLVEYAENRFVGWGVAAARLTIG
jgi:hypothetical protein